MDDAVFAAAVGNASETADFRALRDQGHVSDEHTTLLLTIVMASRMAVSVEMQDVIASEHEPTGPAAVASNKFVHEMLLKLNDITIGELQNALLTYAACSGSADIVRRLLDNGAVKKQDVRDDRRYLRNACAYGQTVFVRFLVEEVGHTADTINRDTGCALVLACKKGHYETARALFEVGGLSAQECRAGVDMARTVSINGGNFEFAHFLAEKLSES